MKTLLLVATCVTLSACAANSGVVPMGQGNYMVTRQAATGFGGSGTLKTDALREANAFCVGNHKELTVVNIQEAQPPFLLGNYPKADVQFTCS